MVEEDRSVTVFPAIRHHDRFFFQIEKLIILQKVISNSAIVTFFF